MELAERILNMHYSRHLPPSEIAKALGTTEYRVKSEIVGDWRAKKQGMKQ